MPFPSPRNLPDPGIKPGLLLGRQILYHSLPPYITSSNTFKALYASHPWFKFGLRGKTEFVYYMKDNLIISELKLLIDSTQ